VVGWQRADCFAFSHRDFCVEQNGQALLQTSQEYGGITTAFGTLQHPRPSAPSSIAEPHAAKLRRQRFVACAFRAQSISPCVSLGDSLTIILAERILAVFVCIKGAAGCWDYLLLGGCSG
jgi:hypothetical protein